MGNVTKTAGRAVAAVFAVCAAAIAPLGAAAADSTETIGDLVWSYYKDDGKATVTGVSRTTTGARVEGTVTVPATLGEAPVAAIGYQAFQGQEFIREVVLPSGVTTLDTYCFRGCKRLATLELPSTVLTIGVRAFEGCSALATLTLNEGLTSIGDCAFDECAALKSLTLPSTVQTLGTALFSGLPIETMELPDSVTEIGTSLFKGCGKLESVVVGTNITELTYQMFDGCAMLTSVTLKEGYLDELDSYCFRGCKRLATLELPPTVLTIGVRAFEGCSALATLTLHEGLTSIGDCAFDECAALKSLTLPSTVQTLGDSLFSGLPLETMELPDSVTEIGTSLFKGCGKLESVVVGKNITGLSYQMFDGCEMLTSVTFKDDAYLDSLVDYCFRGCKRLTTLALPSDVLTIGVRAFDGCSALATLTLNEGLTSIGDAAFDGCESLKSLTLPSTVQTLGVALFSGLPLETMELPDSVTTIGSSLFRNCAKLESVVVGNNISVLSYLMFDGCVMLSSVTLKEGYLDELDSYCFMGCRSLATLVLPSTVRTIGFRAFDGCAALRSVTINNGLTELRECAFAGCTALHYVYFQGDMPKVGDDIFYGASDRMVVYVSETSSGFDETFEGHPVRPVSEKPENADAPYDFFPFTLVDEVDYEEVEWSAPVILTTKRYISGVTVPATAARIREGEPIYLSYSFGEFWHGEPFVVSNLFTLGGDRSGSFTLEKTENERTDMDVVFWTTNAAPALLQNLPKGSYTLTLQLNGDHALGETDYSNNTTSIAFKVVAATHTVTFNGNGGSSEAASRKVKDGAAVGKLPSATKSGYVFDGWYTAKTGGRKISASTTVLDDMTVYARWAAAWTVTWNANGGKIGSATTSKVFVRKGAAVGTLPKATRKGYTFKGWFTKTSGGTKIKATTKITKSATYYAQWTANKYTIKFNKNGGKGTMKTLSATYGKNVTLTANAFTKAKYKFAGWATKKNGKVAYKNKAKVKNLTDKDGKTVTLYAVWNKAKSGDVKAAATAAGVKTAAVSAAAPTWAVGTFCGGDEGAFTTITVSRAGKVSGKVLFEDGGKWTIVGKAVGQRLETVVTDVGGNSEEVVFAVGNTPDGRFRIESEDGSIWAE